MSTTPHKLGFNPWPWSIIGFFSVAVMAAVVWVVFCIRHGTDLVAADYYEQEVEYQTRLDSMEHARELADRASISYEPAEGFIRIQLPPEQAILHPDGVIHLYRPSQASLDQTLPLQVTTVGEQRLNTRSLAPGLWDVRVQWIANGEAFFVNQRIVVIQSGSQPTDAGVIERIGSRPAVDSPNTRGQGSLSRGRG